MTVRPNKKFDFTLATPRERAFTLPKLRGRSCAFTLVELLIAAGITVVIVVLLGTMLGSLMSTASRASQRVDSFRDARAALQMMERDLSNLVQLQPNTGNSPESAAYFALTTKIYADPSSNPTATPTPPATPTPTPPANDQIYALCAVKVSATGSVSTPVGDLYAVGYYCRWDITNNRYVLCRYFNPNTFSTIRGPVGTSASALYTPGTSDEVLAACVWNFRVTMYDATGNPTPSPSPNPNPYPSPDPYVVYDPANPGNSLPAAIEISFYAMSPQAARTAMSVPSRPADWMNMNVNLVNPHAYQFRTRITFQ